jgi:hypothetical protein
MRNCLRIRAHRHREPLNVRLCPVARRRRFVPKPNLSGSGGTATFRSQ